MFEAHMTVVGTVITNPVKRSTPNGDEVLTFRIAANSRRFDRAADEWVDGGTLYATVTCWRRLVANIGASLMKGDPVIVTGIARTNEYLTKDGAPRADLDVKATAVGPDLARCTVRIERTRPKDAVEPAADERIEHDDTLATDDTPGGAEFDVDDAELVDSMTV